MIRPDDLADHLPEIPAQNVASLEQSVALTLAHARLAAARMLLSIVRDDSVPVDKERHRFCVDVLKLGVDAPDETEPPEEPAQVRIELVRVLQGTLGGVGRAFLAESDPQLQSGGGS